MILKYDEDIQKKLGLKTKAEQWLHIGIVKDQEEDSEICKYILAIWVWDTRDVIELKSIKINPEILKETTKAADNGEPLKGRISIGVHGDINKLFFKYKNKDTDTDTDKFIAVAFSEYGTKLATGKGSSESEAKNNLNNEIVRLGRESNAKNYKFILSGRNMEEISRKLSNMKH